MSARAAATKLILASSSPRRRDLLRAEGFEFEIARPAVDESARPGESPEAQTQRLALDKANAVRSEEHNV